MFDSSIAGFRQLMSSSEGAPREFQKANGLEKIIQVNNSSRWFFFDGLTCIQVAVDERRSLRVKQILQSRQHTEKQ
jgi:hypothetical protein